MLTTLSHTDKMVTSSLIFQGPKETPFLAPRGVWYVGNMLLISDTGQNRVFCWKELPRHTHADPDFILGQPSSRQIARNAGETVSAHTMLYPSGIWSDGHKLVVADAWNHRVLIWNQLPEKNGTPADVVIGQPDFDHNLPNINGLHADPSSRSLYWPYGVYSNGKCLWIADTGNRRVLYYEAFPSENHAPADRLVGKKRFDERDYDSNHAVWPYSVKISWEGKLAITDTQYYRVLLWDHWMEAFESPAQAIVGQPDFTSNGQNQFGFKPAAHTLNWCYDSHFQDEHLFVADTGNSRLLYFREFPTQHNAKADDLIGQKNFETGSENPETVNGTDGSLYWPFSVTGEKDTLVVADTGNHRLVIMKIITRT